MAAEVGTGPPASVPIRISVIVVNFNAGRLLDGCLESVAQAMGDARWSGVVIDNASTDGSAAGVEARASSFRLIRNDRNAGFARAANQGIAATSEPFVLLLNPDTELLPGAVAALAAELAARPECAVVGPKVLNEDGTVQGSARGDPTWLTGLFGRTTLLSRWFPSARVTRRNIRTGVAGVETGSVEVDWLSGACWLGRRSAIESAGGFDERFFLYWEDADLCRRLRAGGHTIRYVPGAAARHIGGVSRRAAPRQAIRAFHRSAYRYYSKHVAISPLNPARWMALAALSVRCWVQLAITPDRRDGR